MGNRAGAAERARFQSAESEAQDEFVPGFGNPQSGLCHALQAERCHLEKRSLECGALMHLEMLPLPFLLLRNSAWFHSTAGSIFQDLCTLYPTVGINCEEMML
ncbi:hypothetical protein DV515_00000309 [Chloebia gouldiae]|uniref:Uncharacterized protein n=1 Tax=Chloebia gouldiae TaxID=44316 RepID=A0A3L8SZZ5_CHLGU|nr:hypothetical protein DV515_00000309 [Chloebia gouldiae]